MKQRLTVQGGQGVPLVNREGEVVATLTSVTLDVPEPLGGFRGGSFLSSQEQLPQDGGVGETKSDDSAIERVWAGYVAVMQPRRTDLDPEARKVIREALKVASVEECVEAIRKCSESDFHMGKNDRGRKYNRISQVLKGRRGRETTRERIDFFLDLDTGRSGGGETSGDSFKIETLKDRVRRGGKSEAEAMEQLATEYGIATTFSERRRGEHVEEIATFGAKQ